MSRSVTPGSNNVSGVCGVAVFVLIRARQAVDLPRFFVGGVVAVIAGITVFADAIEGTLALGFDECYQPAVKNN
jgi:hypothetical protein